MVLKCLERFGHVEKSLSFNFQTSIKIRFEYENLKRKKKLVNRICKKKKKNF